MSADYCRIQNPDLAEHFVYRLYGRRGRLLYIGCSQNLSLRLSEHRRNARMRHLIADVETEGPFNYEDARRRERELIEALPGAFNTEWTPLHRRGLSLPQLMKRGAAR